MTTENEEVQEVYGVSKPRHQWRRQDPMTDEEKKKAHEELTEMWDKILILIESMELDVRRHAVKDNEAAARRYRRGLRLLKAWTHRMLMHSIFISRDKRNAKLAKKEKMNVQTSPSDNS